MTSSNPPTGGIDANSRGIAVLVVAVVVGFLLLLNAGGSGATNDAATGDGPPATVDISGVNDDPEATTTLPDEDDAPDPDTEDPEGEADDPGDEADRQPGDVTVAVLNGGGPAGAAAATSATIVERGYQAGPVTNTTPGVANLDTSKVYYAEGYQAEATAVAGLLGKADDAVEAMPEPPPGQGLEESNVVVVLGKDTPPVGADPAPAESD